MNNITMTLQVDHLIMEALREDISSEDVTTNAVMHEAVTGEVDLICKQDGVIAGLQIFQRVFELLDKDTKVVILLETMAGKGTEVGKNFEELESIISKIKQKENIGVCLDTCHINDAGYDLNYFDKVLDSFDKIIGLDKLKCIHVNDSKNIMGSHKDRHENIGYGHIGFDNLINIVYNKRLDNIPKILETPYIDKTYPPYKYEIEMIRTKKFNKNLIDECKQL